MQTWDNPSCNYAETSTVLSLYILIKTWLLCRDGNQQCKCLRSASLVGYLQLRKPEIAA